MPVSKPVIYEVELVVDGEIADDYLAWLRGHVMQLLELDGFVDASIDRRERLDEDSEADQVRFCVRYELRDREAFERYLREAIIHRIAPITPHLILCYIAERVLGLPKSY